MPAIRITPETPPVHIRAYHPADRAAADRVLSAAFGRSFLPALQRCERLASAHLLIGIAEGIVVATAAAVDYGRVGYIGMIAVAPAWRGRGLARRITAQALDLLPPGAAALLDATPEGAPIYQRLGFEDAGSAVVYRTTGERPPETAAAVAPLGPDDLAGLQDYDRAAFGADRGEVLARLAADNPGRGVVARRHGRLAGFALAQDHSVGPCLADDAGSAAALLSAAHARCPSAAPTLTVPGDNVAAVDLAAALGWIEQRRLRHMRRGGQGPHPTCRARLFAYANFHFG